MQVVLKMTEAEKKKAQLISILVRYGYPKEFGAVIGEELHSEKSLNRMISYLLQGRPGSAEEIADEMLAIQADKEQWIRKKTAEYANAKYNELLNQGIEGGDKEE